MNFVDAAIALLREFQKPMPAEELASIAVQRSLLEKPGSNPIRSMKGRLTSELNRGGESRLVRVDENLWALREADDWGANLEEENLSDTRPIFVDEIRSDVPSPVDPVLESLDADPLDFDSEEEAPPRTLTPEEQELSVVYADESGETTSAATLNEYRDEQTADEDRKMLPEIRAPRRDRQGRRRERGSSRRESHSNGRESQSNGRHRTDAAAPPDVTPPVSADSIVAAALEVLRKSGRGQPQPIRQLAVAVAKRLDLPGGGEHAWTLVKGMLLREQSRRAAAGLPPQIVHRGRDLFALEPQSSSRDLQVAESQLEEALAALESAHRAAWRTRLSGLSAKMLERVVHVYLHAVGWTEIVWIKRVERSSYATALAPGTLDLTLVSARCGPAAVDRRGVGELRAGLLAKGIERGLLLSPRELSDEAEAELDEEGPLIDVVCGEALAEALSRSEVGMTRRAVTVQVMDGDWISGLLS